MGSWQVCAHPPPHTHPRGEQRPVSRTLSVIGIRGHAMPGDPRYWGFSTAGGIPGYAGRRPARGVWKGTLGCSPIVPEQKGPKACGLSDFVLEHKGFSEPSRKEISWAAADSTGKHRTQGAPPATGNPQDLHLRLSLAWEGSEPVGGMVVRRGRCRAWVEQTAVAVGAPAPLSRPGPSAAATAPLLQELVVKDLFFPVAE